MTDHEVTYPGDPRHPENGIRLLEFGAELGRATYAAAGVAGTCFDLARVFGGVAAQRMYNDPLGTLIQRLREMADNDDVGLCRSHRAPIVDLDQRHSRCVGLSVAGIRHHGRCR
ncbi:MAG: hypothetical protein ACRCYU_00890 [Nocardioides sp.]